MDGLDTVLLTVLSRIAEGSLGEAGAGLWRRLTELARKTGRRSTALSLPTVAPGAGSDELLALARDLSRAAAKDHALADALGGWLSDAQGLLQQQNVANLVQGDVAGSVIQAGEIGTLNL